jgi:hypothetical protein
MVEGQNQQSRNDKATEFQGGTLHLLSGGNAISDGATSITSDESLSTADSDWSISHDNSAGTTTLQNSSELNFGSTSSFTIAQIVLESSSTAGNYLIDDNPTGDTDLSGDGQTKFPSGNFSFTLGGE